MEVYILAIMKNSIAIGIKFAALKTYILPLKNFKISLK